MPGDYSRDSFRQTRHYDAVLIEQGRVQVDADSNEDRAIRQHRIETETIDVIGPCGVPEAAGGFLVEPTPDGRDLAISPGRIYVEGLMCELEASETTFRTAAGLIELDSLSLDDRPLRQGEWVRISGGGVVPVVLRILAVDPALRRLTLSGSVSAAAGRTLRRVTTYGTQPDIPEPPFFSEGVASPVTSPAAPGAGLQLDDGVYIVYLEAWHREITALDDSHLREVALGGPDTATRLKTVWQVRFLPVGGVRVPTCASQFPQWDDWVAAPTGLMNARTRPSDDTGNPCQLPPRAGFLRLENQLYRVEVHTGGLRTQATFKWSREGASVETTVSGIAGSIITVADLGKDQVLGFDRGQLVELVDEQSELDSSPRPLLLIDGINRARREITIDGPVPAISGRPGLKLRRWDQTGNAANGIPMNGNWQDLEAGVQVRFSDGTYRSGDFWLIPARTATAELDWPPFAIPNADPIPQRPNGTRHHFCRLAILRVTEGSFQLQDCRLVFPPLTEIPIPQPGFHVTAIRILRGELPPQELVNDTSVLISLFNGLEVLFDRPPDPATIKRATCYLAVELPFLTQTANVQVAGYTTLMLSATFQVNGPAARWIPTFAAANFLRQIQIPASETAGILARFVMKGNFIWTMPPNPAYLDGDSFGVRDASPANIALQFPSGDRAGGGVFESWFFLRQPQPRPPFTINTLTATPSPVRAEGITELIGDIVLQGINGDPTALGANVPEFNIQITFNTAVTNVPQNSFIDAVLLMCEPVQGQTVRLNTSRFTATTPPVAGVGANGVNYQDGSVPNVFQGRLGATNTVVFSGVPIDPGGDVVRTFRLKNIRVNVSALSAGSTVPAPVIAQVSISPAIPVNNPVITFIPGVPGLDFRTIGPNGAPGPVNVPNSFNPQLNQNAPNIAVQPTLFVTYAEQFASAFKGNKGPEGNPAAVTPQQESGWNNVGTGALQFAPGSSIPVTFARANTGTRLIMRISAIPARVRVFVTTRDVPGTVLTNVDNPPPRATLAALGGTPFNGQRSPGGVPLSPLNQSCFGAPILEIPTVGGAGNVEWEYLDAAGQGTQNETLRFAVAISTNDVSNTQTPIAFAALLGSAATTSLLIPRFVDIPQSRPAFNIA
jgi:hypothetical protein